MFDIGWSELLIVGMVALVVVGPKELPALMRTIGSFINKVKATASDFQSQFKDAVEDGDFAKLRTEMEDIGKDLMPDDLMDDMAGHDFEGLNPDEWNKDILDKEQEAMDATEKDAADEQPAERPVEVLNEALLDESYENSLKDETLEDGALEDKTAVQSNADDQGKHHT